MNLLSSRRLSLAMVLAVAAVHYVLYWGFTIDDAAISFSYARSFVDGHGLGVLTAGGLRTEGYSNFTWVMLLSALAELHVSIPLAAKLSGLVLCLGAVAVCHAIAWRLLADKRLAAGVVSISLAVSLVFWSASGLESSLYVFLIMCLVWALLREDEQGVFPWLSAAIAVALSLTRPEGFVYAVAAVAFMAARHFLAGTSRPGASQSVRRILLWLLLFGAGYGAYLWWHVGYYGVVFPNTVYAKMGVARLTTPGWEYAAGYGLKHGAILLAPAVVVALFSTWRRPSLVLVIFAAMALALPLKDPDWMANYRFFSAFGPLVVLLALIGIDQLLATNSLATRRTQGTQQIRRSQVWKSRVAVAGIFGFAVVNMGAAGVTLASGYKGDVTASSIRARYQDVEQLANTMGLRDPLYLIPDIGSPSFDDHLRILDLAGLADVQIAHSGARQDILKQYVGEQRPEIIKAVPPWIEVTGLDHMQLLQSDYLPVPTGSGPAGQQAFLRKDTFVSKSLGNTGNLISQHGSGVASQSVMSLGVDAPDVIQPNLRQSAMDISWMRTGSPVSTGSQAQPARWQVEIRDGEGREVWSQTGEIGYGIYPSTRWLPDEVVSTHVQLPQLPAGSYNLVVGVIGDVNHEYIKHVDVNKQAAGELARQELESVNTFMSDGKPDLAVHTCESSQAAATGPSAAFEKTCLGAKMQWRNVLTATALGQLQNHYATGPTGALADARGALATVQQLQQIRGRSTRTAGEQALSRRLAAVAVSAGNAGDRPTSYILWQAASNADPLDSHASLQLEKARRLALGVAGLDVAALDGAG